MKKLLIALAFVAGCHSSGSKEPALTSVRYDAWNEDIAVEGGTIVHTQTEYEYDNPTSATPSGSKTNKVLDGKVTPEQVAALETCVRESGFLNLRERYGAEEGQRYYPYRIEVKIGATTKMVEFRSNPEAEGAPDAFTKVEKHLKELSEAVRRK